MITSESAARGAPKSVQCQNPSSTKHPPQSLRCTILESDYDPLTETSENNEPDRRGNQTESTESPDIIRGKNIPADEEHRRGSPNEPGTAGERGHGPVTFPKAEKTLQLVERSKFYVS